MSQAEIRQFKAQLEKCFVDKVEKGLEEEIRILLEDLNSLNNRNIQKYRTAGRLHVDKFMFYNRHLINKINKNIQKIIIITEQNND